jgi:PAS domain S-box-containing protein
MPAGVNEPPELSEGRIRALLEHLPVIVYVDKGPGEHPEYVTANVEEILGYPAQAYMDDPWLWNKTLHNDDRDRVIPLWRGAWEHGTPYEAEYRFIRPDGTAVWVRDHSHADRDAEGNTLWRGVMLDITADKTAAAREAALRLSEERYRSLVEQLPSVVYAVGNERDPGVIYCTPNVAELTGWTASDYAEGRVRWADTIHPEDRAAVWNDWLRAFDNVRPFDAEYRVICKDGGELWVRDSCMPVRPDEQSPPAFWQGVMLDITEERQIRHELEVSERRYRTLVEQLPAVVYVVTDELESRTLYVSRGIEDLVGQPGFKWVGLGEPWMELVHPDDREILRSAVQASVGRTKRFSVEYRVMRPDGRTVWVRDTASLVQGAGGSGRAWQGLILDVTPEHEALQELTASEARRQILVEQLPTIVYEMGVDDDRRTYYVSPHVEDVLGYTREEWLEQSDIWVELLHPDDRELELDAHDQHIASGEPWDREYRLIAADGRVVWVRDRASLLTDQDGRPDRWLGVMLNITPQKQLEAQLREANEDLELRVLTRTAQLEEANELMGLEIAERRRAERELSRAEESYRQLLESVPAVVYRWQVRPADDGSEHWYMSPQVERVLGYTPDEWHGHWRMWRERVHPHDLAAVDEASLRSERTGEPFELQYRYFAKDGHVVWVHDRAQLLARDAAGEPLVFQGVMIDITATKEAERKATEAEEKFRVITERSPVVTYSYTLESMDPPVAHVEYVSPQMSEILGYPLSHWLGDLSVWLEMTHPDDRELQARAHMDSWFSGEPVDIVYRMIAADGHVVWINDRGSRHEGTPPRFLGAIMDVTGRAEELEQLKITASSLSSLVEGIPAITWTEALDAEGRSRFLYMSPQVFELLGYTAEELMSEPGHFERMLHPDDRAAATAPVPDTQTRWESVHRVFHRDGSVRWLEAHARQVTPPGQIPAIWQGITLDVTERMMRQEIEGAPAYETTDPSA